MDVFYKGVLRGGAHCSQFTPVSDVDSSCKLAPLRCQNKASVLESFIGDAPGINPDNIICIMRVVVAPKADSLDPPRAAQVAPSSPAQAATEGISPPRTPATDGSSPPPIIAPVAPAPPSATTTTSKSKPENTKHVKKMMTPEEIEAKKAKDRERTRLWRVGKKAKETATVQPVPDTSSAPPTPPPEGQQQLPTGPIILQSGRIGGD